MFVKTVASFLILGFFYVQLGTSLDCYSCYSPTGCLNPSAVTCDSANANATSSHLSIYFTQNLTNSVSTNFDCFHHNYTSSANNITYKGCTYRTIEPCQLTFKEEHQQLKRDSCYKCSGNLCNRNTNPAGTFSSSMVTMFSSIVVVAVYKALKM